MRLIVPFASVVSPAGRAAAKDLRLPSLQSLLARLDAGQADRGDAWSLSAPHERALARELGFTGNDGRLPWAAWLAARDGIDLSTRAWGLLTPAHWQVGADAVTLADPDALALGEAESRALLAAIAPLFEAEGFAIAWGAPTRWYAAHESLAELATASLDRVIGRNVDRWLPDARAARDLRRLQAEVQMLLHTHPINATREQRGQWPVNSFWLSGCGVPQPARDVADVRVLDTLRAAALAEDWDGWRGAWHALDAGPLRDALAGTEPVTLTLAGELAWQRFAAPAGWWSRFASRWRSADVARILEAL